MTSVACRNFYLAYACKYKVDQLQQRYILHLPFPFSGVYLPSISSTGGSCHKYNFCHNKRFVAINTCLSRQNTPFIATKVWLPLSKKKICRDKKKSLQTNICSDKRPVCRDKNDTCDTANDVFQAQSMTQVCTT